MTIRKRSQPEAQPLTKGEQLLLDDSQLARTTAKQRMARRERERRLIIKRVKVLQK
jgi:hypothetical protein